jgi:hypothetical protein
MYYLFGLNHLYVIEAFLMQKNPLLINGVYKKRDI